MNPLVSVIIVSYNNEIWVDQCLQSLLDQDYKNIEVIWIDNGSKDNTVELVKSEKYSSLNINLKFLTGNPGFAIGNNEGAKIAKGDIIFLLNSDARVSTTTISEVVTYMSSHTNVGIVQNTLLQMKDPSKIDSVGSMFTITGFLHHLEEERPLDKDGAYPIFGAKAASVFVSKKFFENSFLFNDTFGSYFEDTELSIRANLMGFKVMYLKTAPTLHYGGATGLLLQSGRTDFYSFKNRLFCLLVYLNLLNLLKVLPLHLLTIFLVLLAYLSKRQYSKFFAIIRSLIWVAKNSRYIYSYRKDFKKVHSDEEIFFGELYQKLNFGYAFRSFMGYTSRNAKK